MSSIITAAREFRADVLRNDKAMLRQLSNAYEQIYRLLNRQLRELQREIEQAQRAGQTVNRDWLRHPYRYQSLIQQARSAIDSFTNGVSRFIEAQQIQAINLGQSHATGLIQSALPEITFARLPTQAIEELVGVLANGSPLNKVLDRLAGEAAQQIRETLITGLGSGHGVAKIGRDIRDVIDIPRWKALQIARTEVQRAYRSSTLATYAETDD